MIHPDTELRKIDDDVGYGVFAIKRIPQGSITWALDWLDHVIDEKQAAALPAVYQPLLERYAFRDAKGRQVLCWDHGRFVNHSCDSSSLPLGSVCEIAVDDILPGQQITSDYVTLNLTTELTCRCGAARCRGVMRPADLPHYAELIDSRVKDLVPLLAKVSQPLLPFMRPEEQARFLAISSGNAAIPSCREVVGLPR